MAQKEKTPELNKLLTKVKNAFLLILEKLKQEPILVRTVLALAVSLGFVNLTDADINQIDQAVLIVLVLLGSVSARRLVKPLPKEEVKKERAVKKIKKQQKKVAKAQDKIQKERRVSQIKTRGRKAKK